MLRRSLLRTTVFAAAVALAACATPRADLPIVDEASLAERRLAVQTGAVEDALARSERVQRLAWPILTANAELCPVTAPRLGMKLGNERTVMGLTKGLKLSHVQALGWDEAPRVLSVAPGSPAANAGLMVGDRITHIADDETPTLDDVREPMAKLWKDKDPDAWAPLTLTVARGDEEIALSIAPQEACDVAVVSSSRGAINATADLSKLTMYAGLLRALPDDEAVSFVLAHELAHWAGAHPRKVITNSAVSGAVLWGPVLMLTSQVLDVAATPIARAAGGQVPSLTTLTTQAIGATVRSAQFEREADYAGLYMHVRAGGSTENVEELFQLFTNVGPRSSWLRVTHPTTPERQLRFHATVDEIRQKQAAGEALIPDGWKAD